MRLTQRDGTCAGETIQEKVCRSSPLCGDEHFDHGQYIRSDAAPQKKRFSGLCNQHAQAVGDESGAAGQRLRHEGGISPTVCHVISQRIRRKTVGGEWQALATETCRGGVDEHIELLIGNVRKAAGGKMTSIGKPGDQRFRLVRRAVDHQQSGRAFFEQGEQDAARNPAPRATPPAPIRRIRL